MSSPEKRMRLHTYVSRSSQVQDNQVKVEYHFLHDFGSVVIDFGPLRRYSDEEMLARSELMVMKLVMTHGKPTPLDCVYTLESSPPPSIVSLSSEMATKAVKKATYENFSVLHGAEAFAYVFCQFSTIVPPCEQNTVEKDPAKTTLHFKPIPYSSEGDAVIMSPLLGKVRINTHAFSKVINQSVYAINGYKAHDSYRYIVADLIGSTSIIEVELYGKVQEDKKFYAKQARYLGSTKRHLRYTLVPYKQDDGSVCHTLVTVYTRPDKTGQDPHEVVTKRTPTIKNFIKHKCMGMKNLRKQLIKELLVEPENAF